MRHVETDRDSGVEIYQVTEDMRPADNIYGEQPYSSPEGNHIAVRHYADGGREGDLTIVNLDDGGMCTVLDATPRFPAFHGWGEWLYYQEEEGSEIVLKRCRYDSLEKEWVLTLPPDLGGLSYGTVSPDGRFYAVSVHPEDGSSLVVSFDLASGERHVVARNEHQFFKHEQFSRDGTNRILIQANSADVSVVNLGLIRTDAEGVDWLPVDAPPPSAYGRWPGGARYTPRCTGHEAWVGTSDRVFLSTAVDEEAGTNIWTAAPGDCAPEAVCRTPLRFGHISVSRCGRYWIGDAIGEADIPIYVGVFGTGACRRLLWSRTTHDGKQWSHTHPYLTADNRWLIFTSNRSGIPQVHAARLPQPLEP